MIKSCSQLYCPYAACTLHVYCPYSAALVLHKVLKGTAHNCAACRVTREEGVVAAGVDPAVEEGVVVVVEVEVSGHMSQTTNKH
jgi:hypothetical protein